MPIVGSNNQKTSARSNSVCQQIRTVLTYRYHKIHLSQIDHTDIYTTLTQQISHKCTHTRTHARARESWEQVVATLPDWPSLNEILSPCLCTPGTVYGKHRGSIQTKCKMARAACSLAITKMLFIGFFLCMFIYCVYAIGGFHQPSVQPLRCIFIKT